MNDERLNKLEPAQLSRAGAEKHYRLTWPWRVLGLYRPKVRQPGSLSFLERTDRLIEFASHVALTAYVAGGFVAGLVVWNRPTSDVLGNLFDRVIFAVSLGIQSVFCAGFPFTEGSLFDFKNGPSKPMNAWPYIIACLLPALLFWRQRFSRVYSTPPEDVE